MEETLEGTAFSRASRLGIRGMVQATSIRGINQLMPPQNSNIAMVIQKLVIFRLLPLESDRQGINDSSDKVNGEYAPYDMVCHSLHTNLTRIWCRNDKFMGSVSSERT